MKNLSKLGTALNKAQQKTINGGKKRCTSDDQCSSTQCCSPVNHVCLPQNSLYCLN